MKFPGPKARAFHPAWGILPRDHGLASRRIGRILGKVAEPDLSLENPWRYRLTRVLSPFQIFSSRALRARSGSGHPEQGTTGESWL